MQRIAFVGQGTYFEACSLEDGVLPGVRTTFLEFRQGGDPERLRRGLDAFAPDAIVVFRPEILPEGLLRDRAGVHVLGFLTEPLPRKQGKVHVDLQRRLEQLSAVDPANVDRVVAFDPLIAQSADAYLPVWRSTPLPVADRYYVDPRSIAPRITKPQALFVGRSTKHREKHLEPVKHSYDVLHLAHGVDADALAGYLGRHEVAINLHNEDYVSFENRVCLHLAAGHLVLTERLEPLHGLEPGIDLVEIDTPESLWEALGALRRHPGMWHAQRVRGRFKAESFRASRVWPRLLWDLAADVGAHARRTAA